MRSTVRSLLTGLSAALVAFGCADRPTSSPLINPPPPTRDISDGAHNSGNPHFFFLPPMVPQPSYSGTPDGTLSPVVKVCEWVVTTSPASCGTLVAYFTTTSGTGSETVRYDATAQQYIVNWHTDQCISGACTLDPQKVYRLCMFVGIQQLGHADVQIVGNGSQLKNVQTGAYIGLVDGRTLPVKFRIEQGAVAVAAPGTGVAIGAGGGTIALSDGSAALAIPAGAVSGTTTITAQPAVNAPPSGAWTTPVDLGPTGTTFATPVTLTLPFDPGQLPPGIPPSALAIVTADDQGGWAIVPNSTPNAVDNTVSAPISHFSTYSIAFIPNQASNSRGQVEMGKGDQRTFSEVTFSYQTTPGQYCYYVQSLSGSVSIQCVNNSTVTLYPVKNLDVYWATTNLTTAAFANLAGPASYFSKTTTDATGLSVSTPLIGLNFGMDTAIVSTSPDQTAYVWSMRLVYVEPKLAWTVPSITVGVNQLVGPPAMLAMLQVLATANTSFNVASDNQSIATVGPQQVMVQVGQQAPFTASGPIFVSGIAPGTTTLRTLPVCSNVPCGFVPDSVKVTVAAGQLAVQIPVSLPVLQLGTVTISVLAPDGVTPARVVQDERFDITPTNLAVFDASNNPITSITILAGASATTLNIEGLAAGPAAIQFSNGKYVTATGTTTIIQTVAGVKVTPPSNSPVLGQTVQLTATPLDGAGNPVSSVLCTWDTSDRTIATVSSTGLVTTVAVGGATISATCQSVKGSATVTVLPPPVARVTISPSPVTLTAGAYRQQLAATTYDANGNPLSGRTITWSSSDQSIFTVDASGVVTATGGGSATVSATSEGITGTARVTVVVAATPSNDLANACGRAVTGIAFDGFYYYVAEGHDSGVQCITRYDAGGTKLDTKQFASDMRGLHYVPATHKLVTRSFNGAMYAIDYAAGAMTQLTSFNPTPDSWGAEAQPAADPDGQTFWVFNPTQSTAERRRLADNGVVQSFAVSGGNGFSPAISVSNNFVFITNGSTYNRYAKTGGRLVATQPTTTSTYGCNGGVYFFQRGSYGWGASASDDRVMYDTDCSHARVESSNPAGPNGLMFVAAFAGYGHSCAVQASGTAYCWGRNDLGQLSSGVSTDLLTPALAAGGPISFDPGDAVVPFSTMSAGDGYTCAVGYAGRGDCWGRNDYGQLGNGTANATTAPVWVANGSIIFKSITTGTYHTCGIATTGAAYCWGRNDYGQLGNSTASPSPTLSPVLVGQPEGPTWVQITVNEATTCGLTAAGNAYCWGNAYGGVLGSNTSDQTGAPRAVIAPAGVTFTAIAGGFHHTCAIGSDSFVYCWGYGDFGQNGASIGTALYVPTIVSAPNGQPGFAARSITTGAYHSCAVAQSGGAYCWGAGVQGILGNGSTTTSNLPVPVTNGGSFTAVNANVGFHTCAVAPDGVYCWGIGDHGALGGGSTASSSVPVRVVGQP